MDHNDEEETKEEDKEEVLSLQMAKDRISNSGHTSMSDISQFGERYNFSQKRNGGSTSEQKLGLNQRS
jgi:hypothetical protein